MSKFKECELCGAALDPGEKCDCQTPDAVENGQILGLAQSPIIYENLFSVEQNMSAIRDSVYNLPLTEESLKEVKRLRAKIRKQFAELEEQRKAVRKGILEPYEDAEKKYKAFVRSPFERTDGFLKAWIDGFQDTIKIQCENQLKEYFDELCLANGIDFLAFGRCGVVVDMAMARQKEPRKAMEQIYNTVMKVRSDMDAILNMEDAAEIMAAYRRNPSLSEIVVAINEQKRDRERMARFLEEQRRQQEQQSVERAAMIEAAPEIQPEPEDKYSVCFQATGTLSALKAMKAHATALGITFEEIEQEEENNE